MTYFNLFLFSITQNLSFFKIEHVISHFMVFWFLLFCGYFILIYLSYPKLFVSLSYFLKFLNPDRYWRIRCLMSSLCFISLGLTALYITYSSKDRYIIREHGNTKLMATKISLAQNVFFGAWWVLLVTSAGSEQNYIIYFPGRLLCSCVK